MTKSISVAKIQPQPERKLITQGMLYESLANLADPDAFDATDLLLDNNEFSASRRDPICMGDILDGLTQLATTGAIEMTEIIATIHCEIMLRPLGLYDEKRVKKWQRGLTGQIYHSVQQAMQLVGNNLGAMLQLYNHYGRQDKSKPLPDSLKLFVNALNGVMGDHLVSLNNPLEVPMTLYNHNKKPQHQKLSGRIIILAHGLCMSYLSWNPGQDHGLGETILAKIPDATLLYLDYNTGKRISINGHCLASMLQSLVEKNPDIAEIDLIGHSMGGLVARSALFYGKHESMSWVNRACRLITLGSPHQGAILERVSYHALEVLSKLPFAGSLAKLGELRSAGIIDLRHGSIRNADWRYLDGRDVLPEHFRHPAKLPIHVNTFLVAGFIQHGLTTSKTSRVLGDGLVTVESALGEHAGDHTLCVPDGHKAVFYGVNHIDLQHNTKVHNQVVKWLMSMGEDALNPRIYSYVDDGTDLDDQKLNQSDSDSYLDMVT